MTSIQTSLASPQKSQDSAHSAVNAVPASKLSVDTPDHFQGARASSKETTNIAPAAQVPVLPSEVRPSEAPREAQRAVKTGFASWLGVKLGIIATCPPRCYDGRWALITGASSGIGACFAEELARRSANVMLAARSEDKLRALATRLSDAYGVRAEVFVTDFAADHAVPALMQQIQDRGLHVDVLVNNAGLGSYGRSEDTDPERQRAMLAVNVGATTELAQACLPHMRTAGEGTIFNVASIAAFVPMPYLASYAATKAYVLSFSEGLWAENRQGGVRVLAVCPGATATAFFDGASLDNPEAAFGSLATCQSVVDASLRAVDHDRCYVITNSSDYMQIQTTRLAPRATVATFLEQTFRPGQRKTA